MQSKVNKVWNKAAWSIGGMLNRKPKISVLHRKESERYPDVWPGMEYVCRIEEPVFIEPEWGYIFTEKGVLIEEAIAPQFRQSGPVWAFGIPDPAIRNGLRRDSAHVVHYPETVSMRDFYEWNYYHFNLDVLGKLQLLHQMGVSSTTPLILGRYAHQLSFPSQLTKIGKLAARTWVVPDAHNRTLIHADSAVYVRTLQPFKTRLDYLVEQLEVVKPSDHSDAPEKNRRVFLVRNPPAPRNILNMEEIRPILERYEFHLVDSARLSVPEQIELFQTTRYLIAVHGAGIINTMYRTGRPMGLLELHPSIYGNGDFMRMAGEYGYHFQRLLCDTDGGVPQHANINVPPDKLAEGIEELLKRN